MGDVSHDAVHCTGEVDLIFVVHSHADQEFRLSCGDTNILSQFVPVDHKIIRIAGDSGVSHMSKLTFVSSRQKAVKNCRDFALKNQLAVDQSDLFLGRLCFA